MDQRQLLLFITLCDEMHFGRAAERLGIAQSALSRQIARIEDVLGGRLLERGRRSAIALTPAGRTFLAEAKEALRHIERAERIGRLAMQGRAGQVRIGYVFSAVATGILPRALELIRAQLAHMSVEIVPMETASQIEALVEARIDVGFVRPRSGLPDGVRAQVVHGEPLVLAMRADHPLAQQPVVTPAQLGGQRFIVPRVTESPGVTTAVTDLARHAGIPLPDMIDTSDFPGAASLAAAGYGLVLGPRSLGNLRIEGLVYRNIADYPGSVELAVAWRGPPSRLVEVILKDAIA